MIPDTDDVLSKKALTIREPKSLKYKNMKPEWWLCKYQLV